jgi:hypothetical protein
MPGSKYNEFVDLYATITDRDELAKRLSVTPRAINKYKQKYALCRPNDDVDMNIYKKLDTVFLKSKYRHCIDLTGNGYCDYRVEHSKEYYKRIDNGNDDVFDISCGNPEYGRDKRGSLTVVISIHYKLYYKTIKMTRRSDVPKIEERTIYSIYTGDRYDCVRYDNYFWTVNHTSINNKGLVYLQPYTLQRFANRAQPNRFNIEHRWIVYDIEAIMDDNCKMTPYIIAFIEFDPDNVDFVPQEKILALSNVRETIKLNSSSNEVLEEFRKMIFEKIESSYKSFVTYFADRKENVNTETRPIKYTIFGYNNYRFDDMLINPVIKSHIFGFGDDFSKKDVDLDNKYFQTISARNGQIFSSRISKIATAGSYYDPNENQSIRCSAIEFKDLIKWTPDKTLREVCKDYNIGKDSKMDFDIVKYNKKIKDDDYYIKREMNLKDACDTFLMLKGKKKEKEGGIDYESMKLKAYYNAENDTLDLWELCKDYCLFDCKSTMLAALKISNLVKEIIFDYQREKNIRVQSNYMFSYNSPATLAYQFLSRTFAKEWTTQRLAINHSNFGRFIHQSYFGGRTDFSFIGKYTTVNGNLRYYDVTSEYPLAMMKKYPVLENEQDMTVGKDVNINYYQNIINKMVEDRKKSKKFDDFTIFRPFDEDFNAIFRCNLYPPKNNCELITFAPMATRFENKALCYENLCKTNIIVCTAFLKNFIMSGYSVELLEDEYNVVFTKLEYIFTEFIQYFGRAKAESKEDENKSKAKLFKLIINSIAGKLAQKPGASISNSTVSYGDTDLDLDKLENWAKSNHYLATFIIGEANFILYSTLYRLQLTNIYNNVPHSDRCGALLYMDTDSIIFDADLCDELDWDWSEYIGTWDEQLNYFHCTWKAKYTKKSPDSIVCLGKKSYMIMKGDTAIDVKLKGIHRDQMERFANEYNDILNGDAKTVCFEGLVRKAKRINGIVDITKEIFVGSIQKTLTAVDKSKVSTIECTNKKVLEKNCNNNIFFCTSKYNV